MDQDVVQRILNGDVKSFESLVEKYQSRIFSFCYRLVKETQAAEDLTQESFIRAYTRLGTYNPDYKFSSWLYKIAQNLCNDFFRKASNAHKQKSISLDKLGEDGSLDLIFSRYHANPSAEEIAMHNFDQRKLKIDLGKGLLLLSKRDQNLIRLRYQEELSYREISEVFDVKENNIKVMLHRARNKMKAALIKINNL